ncbi:MAG: Gfo/Idh/MocA family protein [Planctomycetota bacterium]|jgi:predicted dehydrogenase
MAKGFAILGAGMIAPLHADAIKKSDKAELVAICDLDEGRAKELAEKFAPDAKIYTSLDDILADTAVEVVNVVTPNHLHTEAVLKIAAAKKHIMCEKPPAMSLADTDKMMKACDDNDVLFGIYVQCRTRKPVQLMKKAIAEGRFGKIYRADATMKWFRSGDYYKMDAWRSNRKSGAGVTIQHAFHYIDLIQYLMGPAAKVDAKMCNLGHSEVKIEDTLDARIEFKNGAIGAVQASTALWPGSDPKIEVYGEKGSAVMDGAHFSMWQFQDEKPEDEEIRNAGDADQKTAGSDPTALDSIDHQIVIDNCCDVMDGNGELIIPCSDVRPTLEMALGMYMSDKTGEKVEMPLMNEDEIWD